MGTQLHQSDHQLYRSYFAILRAKCGRLLGDREEAADVAQEALIRLWQSGPSEERGHEPRQILAWLYRTSTHLAIDRLRQRQARHRLQQAIAPEPAEVGVEPLSEEQLAARRLFSRLAEAAPADELEIAVLSRIDRMTQSEIAEVLAISERTVRRQLQRFDARVQTFLEELADVRTA